MINLKTHLCLAAIITTTQNSPPKKTFKVNAPALTRHSTIRHSILAPKIITDTQSTTTCSSPKKLLIPELMTKKMLVFTAMPGEKQVTTLKKLDHKSLTSRKKKCASSLYLVSLYLVTISFSTTKMYKQVNGCARGSPISHVVTNLCMEKAKESAITASLSFQIWKQYIADSFCPGGKMQCTSFHNNTHNNSCPLPGQYNILFI